eukprot:TRINITY_DN647_c0_g1_i1.p1 TRINITY_DN647_c0_g1~~TRINITY_DN647_c0_g1_i1.p1  ORF type:complete len:612 (-),score=252.09 TRINITY_DN647_c0_g1_i1:128-1786(-)
MAEKKEYKVANLKEIEPFQKREVAVGEGGKYKILLTNVEGKIYATGHKCTHYGAPLVNGVLTSTGRLVCPWHGACFNVANGDIEDAPALDSLVSYQVRIEDDGTIYVTADEEDLKKEGRRKPGNCVSKKQEKSEENAEKEGKKVVIVGGGASGLTTAEALRENGFDGKITVVSKEPYLPIDRTKLSKTLMTDLSKLQWRDEAFFKEFDIQFKTGTHVKKIDRNQKKVELSDSSQLPFDSLVLASGSKAKRLELEGFDKSNVCVLRTVQDAEKIVKEKGEEKKKVLIVGSSFIGMELATCLAKEGHQVTVIGRGSVPLGEILGEKIGNFLKGLQESNGVKFEMKAKVAKAFPSETDGNKAGGIEMEDGSRILGDFIILGVGVSPDTEYLKESGFQLEKDGGIKVDAKMQVEEGIYAVGDIAHFPYVGHQGKAEGQPLRIEHWNVAQNQGRVAALNICGKERKFEHVPYFWSAQGQQIRYCGNTQSGYDDVVVLGSMEEKKFVAYYTKGEEVLAVLSVGYDPAVSKSSELMHLGKMPKKSEFVAGLDIRNVPIA